MTNASNSWEVIEAAYQNLQDSKNLPAERPADPSTLTDYDLRDAVDQTAYEITGAPFPEIALLQAFAREGYLDNDPIWEAIGEAVARGLEEYNSQQWEDYRDSLEDPDGWGL